MISNHPVYSVVFTTIPYFDLFYVAVGKRFFGVEYVLQLNVPTVVNST